MQGLPVYDKSEQENVTRKISLLDIFKGSNGKLNAGNFKQRYCRKRLPPKLRHAVLFS